MPTIRAPRKGSLQYWPRKRAKRQHARVRTWNTAEAGPAGFAGFKAGMTHVVVTDNRKNSPTKGQDITVPVTIIECPPLKVIGVRLYKANKKGYGEAVATEVRLKAGKELQRTTDWKETGSLDELKAEEHTKATLLVHTQPNLTGIGQKKPHIFEIGVGGSVADAIAYAKEHSEISVADVIKAGDYYDAHAVSTGKGTQGAVKRFGIGLRSHKSEKSTRKAVLGPEGYGKVTYTSIQAGKMGYHLRTEYNKKALALVEPDQVRISGGIVGYGEVKNTTLLLKGSVPGPKKRLITIKKASRPDPKASKEPMEVVQIITRSQQGNI
jgi:large subunit ribosomal protein L3